MSRLAYIVALTSLIANLLGCATLNPEPKTLSISQERLMQLISGQFPLNSKVLEVFDVVVSAPKISLDATNNRINTSLDLNVVGNGILGLLAQREYKGALDLSYGLRFEPSDNSVRMTDVKLNKLKLEGAPDLMGQTFSRLGVALGQKLLAEQVLYRVSDKDMQAAKGWGYKPGAFKVSPTGLLITLEPIEQK
jgi:hypothetical protein